jgi:hypothetical protein
MEVSSKKDLEEEQQKTMKVNSISIKNRTSRRNCRRSSKRF